MRILLALAALTILIQPSQSVPAGTMVAQSNECTGPNCPPPQGRDCEHEKEKTVS